MTIKGNLLTHSARELGVNITVLEVLYRAGQVSVSCLEKQDSLRDVDTIAYGFAKM